jgi:hypothetical protein
LSPSSSSTSRGRYSSSGLIAAVLWAAAAAGLYRSRPGARAWSRPTSSVSFALTALAFYAVFAAAAQWLDRQRRPRDV